MKNFIMIGTGLALLLIGFVVASAFNGKFGALIMAAGGLVVAGAF